MTDINVGAISEALNDKLDRNGLNAGNPCAVVIETYTNGTSGYRIWSDGYCEQWGITTMPSNNVRQQLLKTYANTDYLVILTCGSNTTAWPIAWTNNGSKTTSSFWFDGTGNYTGAERTIQVNWITKGYIR